jgi:hypothetical protein
LGTFWASKIVAIRKSIFEKIYHYKAPIFKDNEIKSGCYQFRKYHEDNFNPEWVKNQVEYQELTGIAKREASKYLSY